ncbi:MAG: helix-turn-helix transcriptional regulator [Bacteroidales bacterium]
MRDRLLKFLNKEQLSYARFAETIGVQPSNVSHILSGRNKPGFDFIQKILTGYPSLNADWLITGKGSMYKADIRQGDLFGEDFNASQPAEHTGEKLSEQNTEYNDSEEDIADSEKHENEFTNVNKNIDGQNYKSKTGNEAEVNNVNKQKSIQKIIILYTDKSFTEYFPEE